MKKTLLTSLIAAAVFAVVTPVQTFAKENQNKTVIRGNVYGDNHTGIGDVTVNITCVKNDRKVFTGQDTTDGNGLYTVTFNKNKCSAYKPVTATVIYNGKEQSQQVNVSDVRTATLDFYYGTVSSVPEFGLVTGAMAALTSGSSLLAFRRMRKA